MLVSIELWARPGTVTLPGGTPSVIWGLAAGSTAEPQLPGPVIEATVGDDVEVTLHNTLDEPVSLTFPGQQINPEPVLDAAGRLVSLARPAPPGRSTVYAFPASRPGTFHYEGGTSPELQVQMGLYGALVVRPAGYDNPADPNYHTAYGAGSGSSYDVETVLLLSELDPAAHEAIAGGGAYNPLSYSPQYWLINGRSFPDCTGPADTSTQPFSARVPVLTGQRLLLRVINAGLLTHLLAFQQGTARVVAEDGHPKHSAALDATYEKCALTLGAGQTADLLFIPPEGELYLYDREVLHLANADEHPGGMMTLVDVRNAFPTTAPSAPSDLTAAPAPGQVELTWVNNAVNEDGFILERRTETGPFLRVVTLFTGATAYSDRHVEGSTTYIYRVLAFNSAGKSAYSNEAIVTTPAAQPPAAPSNLTAAAVSTSEIRLIWQDNSTTEDGFRIELKTAADPDFIETGVVPADTTYHTDTGLNPNTTYTYRVCAYNASGASGYSNEASATTLSAIPAAPSNLTANGLPGNRIRLTWQDNSTNKDGFIIERLGMLSPTFIAISRVSPNVTEYIDAGLFPWSTYLYRIRAYNAQGVSPPSNIARALPG
jgi:FtsP/CotA-like multicopper oxidase with cupredoxin domain